MNQTPSISPAKSPSSPAPAAAWASISARALARAGADLVITSRDAAPLALPSGNRSPGPQSLPLALDVRDHDSIQKMAEAAARMPEKLTSWSTTPAATSASPRWT
jgi:hypothetical protein